jgi:hypothetical protein
MNSESGDKTPLPAPDFCNSWGDGNPILGKGALGNSSTGHMYYPDNGNREAMVKKVQTMLSELGYDTGSAGSDGKFGSDTEKAVRAFQQDNKDWNGNALKVDGLVGPETSDALNRKMVAKGWYNFHQTETSITIDFSLLTVKAESLKEPISLNAEGVKKGRIVLVGDLSPVTQTFVELRFLNEWEEPIPGLPVSVMTPQGETTCPTDSDGLIRIGGIPRGQVEVKITDFETFARITDGWQEREARTAALPDEENWLFMTPRDLSRSRPVRSSQRNNIMVMTRTDVVYHQVYKKWENPHLDSETGPWKLKVDPDGIVLSLHSNGRGSRVAVLSSQRVPGEPGESAEVTWFEIDVDTFHDSQQHERTAELEAFFNRLTRDPPDQGGET